MKYMISGRHSLVELEKTDEIRLDYKDKARLADFISEDKKLDKNIYIYIQDENIDWDELKSYAEIFNIKIASSNTMLFRIIAQNDFKYLWSYPATTFQEIQSLKLLGVSEILIDGPLYFDLPQVKTLCGDIELRVVANKCFNNNLPLRNGICGTYIRPEDIEVYSEYIDHIEFDTQDLQKELTLLKVYKYDQNWPGNLNILLDNLKENVDNRAFRENFAEYRINCRQVCQRDERCHFCQSSFNLINAVDKNRKYLNETYGEI